MLVTLKQNNTYTYECRWKIKWPYCKQTLTRYSWIHYTDCWIVK